MDIRERIKKEIEIQKSIEGEKCNDVILLKFLDAITTQSQWNAFIDVEHYSYGKLSYETHRFYYPKNELLKFIEDKELISKIKTMLEQAYKNSNNSAAGYDEGYYNGMAEAFEKVLELIEKQ